MEMLHIKGNIKAAELERIRAKFKAMEFSREFPFICGLQSAIVHQIDGKKFLWVTVPTATEKIVKALETEIEKAMGMPVIVSETILEIVNG